MHILFILKIIDQHYSMQDSGSNGYVVTMELEIICMFII
jgi:hypothetical protein